MINLTLACVLAIALPVSMILGPIMLLAYDDKSSRTRIAYAAGWCLFLTLLVASINPGF